MPGETYPVGSRCDRTSGCDLHPQAPAGGGRSIDQESYSYDNCTSLRSESPQIVRKPADVFDRDREWAALAAFCTDERAGATLGIVSGRRRQGKSFLLQAACEQTGGFYFE